MKLSIIIVNWNTREFLEQCLESLPITDGRISLEVIVVDNCSSDGSPEMVRQKYPRIHLIQNRENVGFARANNQALKVATGEYLLLLNPDTVVPAGGILEKWLDFMDQHLEVGASGCQLLFPDGSHQVGDAGFRPSLGTVSNFSLFLSKISPIRFKGLFLNNVRFSRKVLVDWISGADFMVRQSILSQVGLLDESTFMFAEDIEWGCRIRSHGYKIYYLPQLRIIHFQGASSKKQDQEIFSCLWLANLRRLYWQLNKDQSILLYDVLMSLGFFLRVLAYLSLYLITGDRLKKVKFRQMYRSFRFILAHFGKPELAFHKKSLFP